jgi:hypothetical protein
MSAATQNMAFGLATQSCQVSTNRSMILFDARVVLLCLLALVVQQHVLARAEAKLEDVLLHDLDVLARVNLLVVDEGAVGRAEVDDVRGNLATRRTVRSLKGQR